MKSPELKKQSQLITCLQSTDLLTVSPKLNTSPSMQLKKSIVLPPINNPHKVIPAQSVKTSENQKNKQLKHQENKTSPKIQENNKNNKVIANQNGTKQIPKKQRKFVLDQYDEKAVVLCQFCGGQKCPQEDYLTNKIQPNAIQGLHSNWITQNILAMQRPSNKLIQKFDLISQFKKYQINAILNLQEPGQHPYCGDGIDPIVGFSYDPQLFFQKNIRFQNQYWQDMTSTTFEQMMKIMNIFNRSIVTNRGKISVHCHAGRGRTLMAIGAWLIYYDRMTAQQVIDLAVQKRQGVLTRTSQRDFLKDFQSQLEKRWKSYSHQLGAQNLKTFSQFVSWQDVSLLKCQRQTLNQNSFVHGSIINLLRKRMQTQYKQIIFSFIDLNHQLFTGKNFQKWDKQHQHRLSFLKTYVDKKKLQKLDQNQQIRILTTLLQDFYDSLPFTALSLHAVDLLKKQVEVQQSIIKNKGQKRQVIKVQNFQKNILKRWQDIISERPDADKIESPKRENIKKQKDFHHDEIKEKIAENQLQGEDQNNNPNLLKIDTVNSFGNKSNGSFNKSQNNYSQIEINSLYLNVLTQPSVLHQVGFHSLCAFIDLAKFSKQLIDLYKRNQPNESQQHYQLIMKCLLTKFSIILQSKKRYFPVLFRGVNQRQSRLMQKIQKISKYANQNIQYIANFMKNIALQIPIDQRQFKKLIFKLKKVDANVQYFSKSHSSQTGKFFSMNQVQKVYNKARI